MLCHCHYMELLISFFGNLTEVKFLPRFLCVLANCSNIWQGTFSQLPSNCLNQEEILSDFCSNSKYTQTKKKENRHNSFLICNPFETWSSTAKDKHLSCFGPLLGLLLTN